MQDAGRLPALTFFWNAEPGDIITTDLKSRDYWITPEIENWMEV